MVIDYTKFNNTPFSLLIWYVKEGQKDQATVYPGRATYNPETQEVDVFETNSEKLRMSLKGDQLERIKEVTPDMKKMLQNADYGISLTMEDLPDVVSVDDLLQTGISWNQ